MPLTELQALGNGRHKLIFTNDAGEAREYLAAPLDLNDLVEYENTIGPLGAFGEGSKQLTAIRFVVWRALLHDIPDLTIEAAGALLCAADLALLVDVATDLIYGASPKLVAPVSKPGAPKTKAAGRRSSPSS